MNPRPEYAWLASLVKTYVGVNRTPYAVKALGALLNRFPGKTSAWDLAVWAALQQSDYALAAAAMEAPRRLDPADDARARELSRPGRPLRPRHPPNAGKPWGIYHGASLTFMAK